MKMRGTALAVVSAAVVLGMAFAPAKAATGSTGWRVVLTQHYGAASNLSIYETAIAPGIGDAWAFGGTDEGLSSTAGSGAPVAEHWNGVKWTPSVLPTGLVGDISASAAVNGKSVWAVNESGSGDASILHWNGSSWSVAGRLPNTSIGVATGMLAFSDSNVWEFGAPGSANGTGAWHYNGSTWTRLTGIARGLYKASALSPTDVWAIAASTKLPQAALLHYNGSTWQQVTASALNGQAFNSILALSPGNVWAQAFPLQGSNTHLVHLAGGKWSSVQIPWTFGYSSALESDGAGGFWLVGYAAGHTWAVHHTSAGAWSRTELSGTPFLDDIVLVPGTTSLWGAGETSAATGSDAQIYAYGPER